MAINLMNTRDVSSQGVKVLVYGFAGAGKTTLISTLEKPIVLSAEAGLLSLRGFNIPYIEVTSIDQLSEAYNWVVEHLSDYKTVCLDSVSEIAEVVLAHEKKINKDGRQAYGSLIDKMSGIIRSFRDLPTDVYFSCKAEKDKDEEGKMFYQPSIPGSKLGNALPYFFDEVLALRVEQTEEGIYRILQTGTNGLWTAKDRSGVLELWEEPDLGAVMRKIKGAPTKKEVKNE